MGTGERPAGARAPVGIEGGVDAIDSARRAEEGGAARVELCDNLLEGGTTPSAGMITACRKHLAIPLFVMIRPRGGDFLYSADEQEVMLQDIAVARERGVDGVVL